MSYKYFDGETPLKGLSAKELESNKPSRAKLQEEYLVGAKLREYMLDPSTGYQIPVNAPPQPNVQKQQVNAPPQPNVQKQQGHFYDLEFAMWLQANFDNLMKP